MSENSILVVPAPRKGGQPRFLNEQIGFSDSVPRRSGQPRILYLPSIPCGTVHPGLSANVADLKCCNHFSIVLTNYMAYLLSTGIAERQSF